MSEPFHFLVSLRKFKDISNNLILTRLRDKVESQEQKLRKLRQLRGQPDMANANNNGSLTNDLDSIRLMFNEKEKELAMAVTKVKDIEGNHKRELLIFRLMS